MITAIRGQFQKYRTLEIMEAVLHGFHLCWMNRLKNPSLHGWNFGIQTNSQQAHLIIGFKMFADSLKFNGYNQMDIEEWVKTQKADLDYDKKYTLSRWHLLIQFFDRRQNRSIWQVCHNHVRPDRFSEQPPLAQCRGFILNKYRFWAINGFLEGQNQPEKRLILNLLSRISWRGWQNKASVIEWPLFLQKSHFTGVSLFQNSSLHFALLLRVIDLWCNGNTADFDSVILGSESSRSTWFR